MIGAGVAALYLAISLAAMRYAFIRLRNYEIKESAERAARLGLPRASEFDGEARLLNGFISIFIGLFWPVGALVLLITHNPPKSGVELQQEAKAREEYIRKLERELNIGQH
jgi:hypothetical protein